MVESEHFAFLGEHIIAVNVLQCVDTVVAFCNAFYYETAVTIGPRYPHHRLLQNAESAVSS